ncbi:MAG: alpha/beta hydrolase, partial [Gammaproteobacteria bacterium]
MFKLFSLIFYITPNWIYKIIFFNRPHIRNFYIDAKSFALIKIIEKLRKTNLSDLEENEIPNFRSEVESLKSIFRLKISKKKEIRREDIFLKDSRIQLRRYIPSKLESSKTILYFHGGGYVLNSIDTH